MSGVLSVAPVMPAPEPVSYTHLLVSHLRNDLLDVQIAAAQQPRRAGTGGLDVYKRQALTEGFAEIEPDVTVSYDPTGSGAGITGATDKTLDIGLSSRALKADAVSYTHLDVYKRQGEPS